MNFEIIQGQNSIETKTESLNMLKQIVNLYIDMHIESYNDYSWLAEAPKCIQKHKIQYSNDIRKKMNKEIITTLYTKYPNTNFIIKNNIDKGGFFNILYDNKALQYDEDFFSFAYNICFKKLRGKERDNLSIIYDYLGEIR